MADKLTQHLDTYFPYLDYELLTTRASHERISFRIEHYIVCIIFDDVLEYHILDIVEMYTDKKLYSEFVPDRNMIEVLMDVLCSSPDIKAKERDYKINQMLKD